MANLIGEFECNLDAKGRLMVPAGLKKQLEPLTQNRYVVNRSVHQRCLVLYPMGEWETITDQLNKLNRFVKKNDDFVRKFRNGANLLEADKAGRVLIQKRLLDFAGIDKKVVLFASSNYVEIWAKENYEAVINDDWDDFSDLAEQVMGGQTDDE